MRNRFAVAGLAHTIVLGLATLAFGHEFWIEPSALRAAPGARIDLALKVGHGADLTELPRRADRYVRFTATDARGQHDVPGVEGAAPAGFLRPSEAGAVVLAYVSEPNRVELEAAAFERYLKEEGLEHVIELRKSAGRAAEKSVETYSRSAKAIVSVSRGAEREKGGPGGVDVRQPLGLPLELVPDADPAEWTLGGSASLRLLQDGKPIANVLVRATAMDQFECQRSARTDEEGRVRFTISHAGRWRFNAVQMTVLDRPAKSAADEPGYRSIWASLVLEVADATPAKPTANEAPPAVEEPRPKSGESKGVSVRPAASGQRAAADDRCHQPAVGGQRRVAAGERRQAGCVPPPQS